MEIKGNRREGGSQARQQIKMDYEKGVLFLKKWGSIIAILVYIGLYLALNLNFSLNPAVAQTYCNNGVIEPSKGEECENGDLNGENCVTHGFDAGTLKCDNCKFNTSDCCNHDCSFSGWQCADDNTRVECANCNTSDTCDELCYESCSGNECCSGGSCVSEGTCNGSQVCNGGSWISHCGDGTVNCGEGCDGTNLNGSTCQSEGFDNGTLSCSSCTINISGCCDHECSFNGTPPKNSRCADDTTNESCWDQDGDGCREYDQSDCPAGDQCDKGLCLETTVTTGPTTTGGGISIVVKENSTFTGSEEVDLNVQLNTSDSSPMCRYRNDGEFWTALEPCSQGNFTKEDWMLRSEDGGRSVYISDQDLRWNYDEIVLDTTTPDIKCDNCFNQSRTNMIFKPRVEDPGLGLLDPYPAGFASMSICTDSNCNNVLCTNSTLDANNRVECSYSWGGECKHLSQQEYWIRARDILGNTNMTLGGQFSVKKAIGCSCSSDLGCVSGWCYGEPISVCTLNLAPQIYFTLG